MRSIEEFKKDFTKGKLEKGLFTSVNENGDDVIVEVFDDRFTLTTKQSNDWYRVEEYLYDAGEWVYSESYEK